MGVRYGCPYKGSKNAIAEWVVSQFPDRKNFYDLFAGGCAVTHCAMLKGKFKTYTINDVADVPQLFMDAIHGKYENDTRWISREDFYRLKDSDPYVRYCWSFGNNGFNYLYSKEVEPWKKALHRAYVFGDTSAFREMGVDTDGTRADIIKNEEKYKRQYIVWYCKTVLKSSLDILEMQKNLEEKIERNSGELRNYLVEGLRSSGKRPSDVDRFLGTNGMAGHYFGKSQWEFPTREVYERLQSFINLPRNYDEVYGLQELLQSLQSLENLKCFRGSYDAVRIEPDSVIYCDIPYRNTDSYSEDGFNHEAFYDWCEDQTEPVFISEYWMPPERFECVAEIEKAVLLSSGANKKAIEKIFVPKKQIARRIAVKKTTWTQLEFEF